MENSDKSLSQNLIENFVKVIAGGGSFYLLSEKILDQLKHLFDFDSIESAFKVFSFLYAVFPIFCISLYFLFKNKILLRWRSKSISCRVVGFFFLVWSILIFCVINIDTDQIKSTNILLLLITLILLFFTIAVAIDFKWSNKSYLKNEVIFFVPMILLILQGFIWSNEDKLKSLNANAILTDNSHYTAYDLVDDWRMENSFLFSSAVKPREFPISELSKLLEPKINSKKMSKDEVVELVKNRWGAFVNIFQFKMIIALGAVLIFCMLLLFLTKTLSQRQHEIELKRQRENEDFNLSKERVDSPETKALEYSVGVLFILILPLFHPVKRTTVDFDHPFVNAASIVTRLVVPTSDSSRKDSSKFEYDRLEKFVAAQTDPIRDSMKILDEKQNILDENIRIFANRIRGASDSFENGKEVLSKNYDDLKYKKTINLVDKWLETKTKK